MKFIKVKTLDGDIVERMIPENEEDEKHIKKLVDKEKLEVVGSFGDDEDQEETNNELGFE